ncbi:hypothetical protein N7465_004199 [Penicillium sp. CMV-2018d]|nr:hypothetical protein N7465_004199 [Penicillium sp. CMV-2018d]
MSFHWEESQSQDTLKLFGSGVKLENSDYLFRRRQNQGILIMNHSDRQLTFIKPFRQIDRIDLAMACT